MRVRRPARRNKLTYANVISTICLFLLLGGGAAYAASHLGKNSVGTKQLKKNSVTTAKIKKNAVTGAKVKNQTLTGSDINLKKLGTVPSATTASTASGLTAPEPTRLVGTGGQPQFLDGSQNAPGGPISFQPVGFYKDHEGIVHLQGLALIGPEENPIKGIIFSLPPGYRPASGQIAPFSQEEGAVFVAGSNVSLGGKNIEGDVIYTKTTAALLGGITFRAES